MDKVIFFYREGQNLYLIYLILIDISFPDDYSELIRQNKQGEKDFNKRAGMNRIKKSFFIWCALAIVMGLIVAWIDSRPNWDDTGISAILIFSIALIFGYLASQKPWIIALAVSIWIPLFSIISSPNYGGLLALIPGFIGAYIGFFIKREIRNRSGKK